MSNLTSANPTLNYINSNAGCTDSSRLTTAPGCISSLTQAQVATLDPAHIGFDTSLLSFFQGRYPAANDFSQGDGVNTGGYRFTSPTPDNTTTYVSKVDYNLTKTQHIFGRVTIRRENSIYGLPVLPVDPVSRPFIDRSYGYVVSHVWTIGGNKVNQFYYGDTIGKYSFPNAYNPTGADQFSFTGITSPYSGADGQKRRVPIPEFRDDFNWQLGAHNLTAGGLFKFIKTNSNFINNFNFVGGGLQGSVLQGGLDSTVQPADLNQGAQAVNDYNSLFATSLGVIGDISTNYNYTNTGAAVPTGSGEVRAYRYFETEAYVGDTWKVTPKLTLSYGLRYQLYTVPYETHGDESVEFTTANSVQNNTLDNYVKARLAQSAVGNTSVTGLPIYEVELGGKANNGPPLYQPSYKDIAPRLGFAYQATPKIVLNGSAGIVYDRTVINAINFLQDQISYLFFNTQVAQFGSPQVPPYASSVDASLATDPRIGANLNYDHTLVPQPAALTVPYTPYVDDGAGDTTGVPNQPYGLGLGETNFVISPKLKDPYSIAFNLGIQQKFTDHMLLKLSYAGRLGRRLLADADGGQVIDVPDYTNRSTQTMVQAFAALTTQTRACQQAGSSTCSLTPQPWFEDVLAPYGPATRYHTNTNLVNAIVGQLAPRGDISDMIQSLGYYTELQGLTGFLPTNIGIPSQFGSNTYLTNQGNSNFHGLLLTLEQEKTHGLKFEVNYTFSKSIDNTSLSANGNSLFSNTGFICDILHPRACRGNSDFDIRQTVTGDFVYDLPIGHGKTYAANDSFWLNELVGGWSVSGLPSFHTGIGITPYSDAYLASFDNDDPAIFTGNKGDLRSSVNVDHATQTVYGFAGGQAGANKVLSEFRGPIGLEYGSRNLVRTPRFVNLDAGLAKRFEVWPEKDLHLTFRADFFNILNHPNLGVPALNIVSNASIFGQISGVVTQLGNSNGGARVGEFSLRLEF